jgi:NADH-quinone oxidoreductase subunit K
LRISDFGLKGVGRQHRVASPHSLRNPQSEIRDSKRMQQLALQHYLIVGAILFGLGLIGFMTRRNLIVMFLCTELMFQGVTVNLIAFGHYHGNLSGQAFTIFVLVIAAAEASLALGLVVLLFRTKHTLDADAWRELKG